MSFKKLLFGCVFAVMLLTACNKELPEPEVKLARDDYFSASETVEASTSDAFTVQHHVSNNNVYINCVVSKVSFQKSQNLQQGKIIVVLNGSKLTEVRGASFVIKDLPKGSHEIELHLVNLQNEPYNLSEKFTITI